MLLYKIEESQILITFYGNDFKHGLDVCQSWQRDGKRYPVFNAIKKVWSVPNCPENEAYLRSKGFHTEKPKESKIEVFSSPVAPIEKTIPINESLCHPIMRPFQREALQFILNRNRSICCLPPGAGKTIIAVTYLKHIIEQIDKRVLIVCPAGLKTHWQRELKKWVNIDSYVIAGTKPYTLPMSDVYIINYDIIKYWQAPLAGTLDTIVCDESHVLQHKSAERTKAIMNLQTTAKHILLLTGTPFRNKVASAFLQFRICEPKAFSNESKYLRTFSNMKYGFRGAITWEGSKNEELLANTIKPFVFIRDKDEIMPELPPIQKLVLTIDGNDKFKKENDSLRDLIESGKINEVERLSKIAELNRSAFFAKRSTLYDYIDSILEDTDDCIAIVCYHRTVIEDICAKYKCDFINGSVKDKQSVVDKFEKGIDRVIALQIQAAGVGFSLLKPRVMVFAEYSSLDSDMEQVMARNRRITSAGVHDSIEYIFPVVSDSIEETQIQQFVEKSAMVNKVLLGKDENLLSNSDKRVLD